MAKTSTQEIDSLISRLSNKDQKDCSEAFDALYGMGSAVVRPLVKALAVENERGQWQAIRILEKLKLDWTVYADDETIAALVHSLDSGDGRIRLRARQFLVAIGPKAVPVLVKTLKEKDVHIRWEAAKALGQIGDPQAIKALIGASR